MSCEHPEDRDQLAHLLGRFPPEIEPSVLAAVAVRSSRPSEEDVVAVLRDGVERVVDQCMGVELAWRTAVVVQSDELRAWSWVDATEGLDWDDVLGRGAPLVEVAVAAEVPALRDYWWHPRWRPVTAVATFPFSTADGAVTPQPDAAVRLSMHRWAMYGGGEDLARVAGFVQPWLLEAADRLDADTGYAALDRHTADYRDSPWERATGAAPWERDVSRTLWGHGWGTLLSAAHVDAVGGRSALEALRDTVPAVEVWDVDGRTWVTLGPDPAAVTPDDVAAVRRVLLPALPRGSRTAEDYYRAVARGEENQRLVV